MPGRTVRNANLVLLLLATGFVLGSPGGVDARPSCGGKGATIVRGDGNDVIKVPKHGPQVIVAGGGDDVILAMRNKDRVCAGPGNDRIFAGTGRDKVFGDSGNDYLDLGPGGDKAEGGDGNDVIVGGGGGDKVHGGPGADRIFGGIQDDKLFGDGEDDLVDGGQGIDKLHGSGGNDWLRGDSNADKYFGDAGSDTASFATAVPPGPFPQQSGVEVRLRSGRATGDDSPEKLHGIENVVGSEFNDTLVGKGGGWASGLQGPDSCSGFSSESCWRGSWRGSVASVDGAGSPDPGLVLMGGSTADDWRISASAGGFQITGSQALQAGAGCGSSGDGVFCRAPSVPLGYLLAWGGGGDDSIVIGGGFTAATQIVVDAGSGDDAIHGSAADEQLYGGESGADRLFGGGGDDALVARGGGADLLDGGSGNDQLVTDTPCAGHTYIGGPGHADVAGFGHVTARAGVVATLDGKARLGGAGRGCRATDIHGSEVLEGSRFGDKLFGTNHSDPLILGRGGSDLIDGRGGDDVCRGGPGTDRLISC